MKTIEVSEDALDSVKAMAQKLQEERDILLAALEHIAETSGSSWVQGIANEAIAKVEQG